MLIANQIVKSYGSLPVLKGVDLHIKEKEIISIVGSSGAGKSTLLHILGTLDKQDKGNVSIAGRNVADLKGNELAQFRNENIGFIFQFHNLLPEFTAMENICIPGFIAGTKDDELKSRALELLEMLNLSHRVHHKPSELSGGEQQRVAVARALINRPKIIFSDEPSGNLDSENARQLHELFFTLRDNLGHTFVIVTHNKELADMADRKLEIKDGIISN